MPKRSSRNPLSSARKDAGSKQGRNTNKADQTAQSLWHRKSGAGYQLFISYYGSQPMGVVVDGADLAGRGPPILDGVEGDANKSNGDSLRGMSRAAKKRRRQKEKSGTNDTDSHQHDSKENHRDGALSITSSEQLDASHPLLQAFASQKNHPHLAGFIQTLSRPLPLTLRFREHEQLSSVTELKQLLSKEHSDLISPVEYDPTNSIYQAAPSSSLCKSNLSKLCPKLKVRVVDGSINGTLARQELGSMLPVLGLRAVGALKRGAKVLDLCASPGSKTMQALEIVGGGGGGGKSGRVIANDVHSGRLDTLREAVMRSGLPDRLTARVTYTNYDASLFPLPKSGKLFDGILCDVPCGGDGTIRKDKFILPMWSPRTSHALHGLQVRILLRALSLVKVGGVICYSTCSLNPIEDEAVVSAALSREENAAAFELVHWPQTTLPGFVRRPGVAHWKVAFYDQDDVAEDEDDFGRLSFFASYESAVAAGHADAAASFWPEASQSRQLRLERCTRLFPQDQDTGGFFLALIKRIS